MHALFVNNFLQLSIDFWSFCNWHLFLSSEEWPVVTLQLALAWTHAISMLESVFKPLWRVSGCLERFFLDHLFFTWVWSVIMLQFLSFPNLILLVFMNSWIFVVPNVRTYAHFRCYFCLDVVMLYLKTALRLTEYWMQLSFLILIIMKKHVIYICY